MYYFRLFISFPIAVTCNAVNVTHASKDPNQVYGYYDNVTYTCDSGYEHTAGNLTRSCMAINTWSGTTPECTSMFHVLE